jgi:hypothetical protein
MVNYHEVILENRGFVTEYFRVPPFDLNEGEIVLFNLYGGWHFFETQMLLKDIFSGKRRHDSVIVHQPLTFVPHFVEPTLRRLFWPVTVGEYLKKNADLSRAPTPLSFLR